MIISGGSNIYPREIEEVLLTHPAIAECSVVGRPHAEWGEEVVAFVVARRENPTAELDQLCLRQHRALQAPAGIPLRRSTAQEQLRQDPQDRTAQAA